MTKLIELQGWLVLATLHLMLAKYVEVHGEPVSVVLIPTVFCVIFSVLAVIKARPRG